MKIEMLDSATIRITGHVGGFGEMVKHISAVMDGFTEGEGAAFLERFASVVAPMVIQQSDVPVHFATTYDPWEDADGFGKGRRVR
jgi:hypothetical protein